VAAGLALLGVLITVVVNTYISAQRAQDDALQTYFEAMRALLMNEDQNSRTRTLMRAQTLTVLAGVDSSRKTQVLRFLVEANLVQMGTRGEDPVISLAFADLEGVNLQRPYLERADLNNADLSNANLSSADLNNANLTIANLWSADLHGADLSNANLSNATNWTKTQLLSAYSLEGATMPNGKPYEDWLKSKPSNPPYTPPSLQACGDSSRSRALCSDIGPMVLPTSGGGMSGVPKLTALCLKADIGGVVQFH